MSVIHTKNIKHIPLCNSSEEFILFLFHLDVKDSEQVKNCNTSGVFGSLNNLLTKFMILGHLLPKATVAGLVPMFNHVLYSRPIPYASCSLISSENVSEILAILTRAWV